MASYYDQPSRTRRTTRAVPKSYYDQSSRTQRTAAASRTVRDTVEEIPPPRAKRAATSEPVAATRELKSLTDGERIRFAQGTIDPANFNPPDYVPHDAQIIRSSTYKQETAGRASGDYSRFAGREPRTAPAGPNPLTMRSGTAAREALEEQAAAQIAEAERQKEAQRLQEIADFKRQRERRRSLQDSERRRVAERDRLYQERAAFQERTEGSAARKRAEQAEAGRLAEAERLRGEQAAAEAARLREEQAEVNRLAEEARLRGEQAEANRLAEAARLRGEQAAAQERAAEERRRQGEAARQAEVSRLRQEEKDSLRIMAGEREARIRRETAATTTQPRAAAMQPRAEPTPPVDLQPRTEPTLPVDLQPRAPAVVPSAVEERRRQAEEQQGALEQPFDAEEYLNRPENRDYSPPQQVVTQADADRALSGEWNHENVLILANAYRQGIISDADLDARGDRAPHIRQWARRIIGPTQPAEETTAGLQSRTPAVVSSAVEETVLGKDAGFDPGAYAETQGKDWSPQQKTVTMEDVNRALSGRWNHEMVLVLANALKQGIISEKDLEQKSLGFDTGGGIFEKIAHIKDWASRITDIVQPRDEGIKAPVTTQPRLPVRSTADRLTIDRDESRLPIDRDESRLTIDRDESRLPKDERPPLRPPVEGGTEQGQQLQRQLQQMVDAGLINLDDVFRLSDAMNSGNYDEFFKLTDELNARRGGAEVAERLTEVRDPIGPQVRGDDSFSIAWEKRRQEIADLIAENRYGADDAKVEAELVRELNEGLEGFARRSGGGRSRTEIADLIAENRYGADDAKVEEGLVQRLKGGTLNMGALMGESDATRDDKQRRAEVMARLGVGPFGAGGTKQPADYYGEPSRGQRSSAALTSQERARQEVMDRISWAPPDQQEPADNIREDVLTENLSLRDVTLEEVNRVRDELYAGRGWNQESVLIMAKAYNQGLINDQQLVRLGHRRSEHIKAEAERIRGTVGRGA